jgi:hypothetical protein
MSSVALLVSFTAILALVALGVDLGLLVQRHQQLKTASEAAALAAAHELFDGRLADESVDREMLARQAALSFAAANIVSESPLKLDANRANDPQGDVVVGWMDPPELLGRFRPRSKQQPLVNALLVRTRHSHTGRGGPLLAMGRVVGVSPRDLATESIAAVDRRLVGFRPVGCTNVPLLPLLVESTEWGTAFGEGDQDESDDEHDAGGNKKPAQAAGDLFTVDPRTGEVVAGGDGIPEIRITLGRGQGNSAGGTHAGGNPQGNGSDDQENGKEEKEKEKDKPGKGPKVPEELPAWFVDFTGDELAAVLPHEVLWGLAAADLRASGGQIDVGSQVACLSIAAAIAEDVDLGEVQAALESIVGKPRVFALGRVQQGGDEGAGEILGFAAGVVVESQASARSLTLLVQPIMLNSCTAVVKAQAGVEPNRWIGKVVLVR